MDHFSNGETRKPQPGKFPADFIGLRAMGIGVSEERYGVEI
jgi:hypothetical protein